jgi:hypothetical protein
MGDCGKADCLMKAGCQSSAFTRSPLLVCLPSMYLIVMSIDRSSTPARFLLMWLISRRWVGFHFEQPGG